MTLQQSAICMGIVALLIIATVGALISAVREARQDKVRREYAAFAARHNYDPRDQFARFTRNNSRG